MKSRIITLLLVGVMTFSLAACGQTGAPVTSEDESQDVAQEIPEAVTKLSEEDNKALTGTLTEDYYFNPYFGLQFNKPEGGTIESLYDEGTDLMPFAQTYADSVGGIYIYAVNASEDGRLIPSILTANEDEQGKTEEEIIQNELEYQQKLNKEYGLQDDFELGIETISLAGEEHPAYIEHFSNDEGDWVEATIIIPKGDFVCNIIITAHPENFDEIVGLVEKK